LLFDGPIFVIKLFRIRINFRIVKRSMKYKLIIKSPSFTRSFL